jgi:hypothetical protein
MKYNADLLSSASLFLITSGEKGSYGMDCLLQKSYIREHGLSIDNENLLWPTTRKAMEFFNKFNEFLVNPTDENAALLTNLLHSDS